MIAKLEDIHNDLVNIQRFYLTPDGQKAYGEKSKKLMATPIEGTSNRAAIQLDEPGTVLCIAEGVETSLWLRKRSQWPFWACYCADAMSQVEISSGTKNVYIFPDANNTGKHAAQCAAERLVKQGFRVKIMPPPGPKDWDDMKAEGGQA
jgi:putative DNA primase/helicase